MVQHMLRKLRRDWKGMKVPSGPPYRQQLSPYHFATTSTAFIFANITLTLRMIHMEHVFSGPQISVFQEVTFQFHLLQCGSTAHGSSAAGV